MSEQVEMRECPCCGGDGLVLKSQYGNIGEHWVTCRQCRLKTGWYTTRDDAIAAWNQRAGEADGIVTTQWVTDQKRELTQDTATYRKLTTQAWPDKQEAEGE